MYLSFPVFLWYFLLFFLLLIFELRWYWRPRRATWVSIISIANKYQAFLLFLLDPLLFGLSFFLLSASFFPLFWLLFYFSFIVWLLIKLSPLKGLSLRYGWQPVRQRSFFFSFKPINTCRSSHPYFNNFSRCSPKIQYRRIYRENKTWYKQVCWRMG